jgi:HAMP domain-containing protein
MGIKAKFNFVMLAAFLLGSGLAAALTYPMVQEHIRTDVERQAHLMIEEASAVRGYTDKEVGPLLAEESKVRFLPETIPFFAAQKVFRDLPADYHDYAYKEAALNPMDPADRPTDWQVDIISAFQRNPQQTELITERNTLAGPTLDLARPIRVDSKDCLACHSTPQSAPTSLIDLYGSAGGFGWKLGDIVGAQIVSVPMAVPFARANHLFILLMGGLAAVFAVTLLVLNLLLHLLIVRPVRRISAAASEVSLGNLDGPEYQPKGRDEIASLAQSFNRMRRSVVNAMQMLERPSNQDAGPGEHRTLLPQQRPAA